jgi:hypothetical protein
MRGRGIWIATGLLLMLTMACAEVTTPQAYSAVQAPAITSTALRPTVEQAQVDVYLDGIRAQHTLDAVHGAQTATAEAREAQIWAITVTAEARAAEATATAWPLTVEASRAQATATARAEADATARARLWEQATATAEAHQAALSHQMTVETWGLTVTAVADEQAALNALRGEQLEREELATKRQRSVYPVRAYGPWVVLVVALGLLIYGGLRLIRAGEMRASAIQRDERGDAPLLAIRQRGQVIIYDGDRAFGPVLHIDGHGQPAQPALVDEQQQERVTTRDQAIDLAHRGLPDQRRQRVSRRRAIQMAALPSYRILPPGEEPPDQIIDVEARKALAADWQREEM